MMKDRISLLRLNSQDNLIVFKVTSRIQSYEASCIIQVTNNEDQNVCRKFRLNIRREYRPIYISITLDNMLLLN